MKQAKEFAFKDGKAKQGWKKTILANTDPYGKAGVDFARSWALLMEEQIEAGKKLKDIASNCASKADNDYGITGFMYGCAVSILSQCWKYGEELRIWHNLDTQCKNEGEKANKSGGVLNPALLNIEPR